MTVTIKREYSILPQGEKDEFHHHIHDNGRGNFRHGCLIAVISFLILSILAGVASLTATMFFSDEVKAIFSHFKTESLNETNDHMVAIANDSFTSTVPPNFDMVSEKNENNGVTGKRQNSTENLDSKENRYSHLANNNTTNSEEFNSENSLENHGNITGSVNDTTENHSDSGWIMGLGSGLDNDEIKEKFAEEMRVLEKEMENVMGIRRAEFVIPIFMLACFLSFFSLISLCCCIMMRRKENRRKKLFGKLITDLQTGDSKTVLLNHSDLED